MGVTVNDLAVECCVVWNWAKAGRVYETGPKSFEIDVLLDSPGPLDDQLALIEAAKKGGFIEQALGQANTIRHRLKVGDGFLDA